MIVTPLCSSSAAVAYHRLALCHKLKQAQWTRCLHPLLSLTLQMWRSSIRPHLSSYWLLFFQVLRFTVKLKLSWCRDLSRSVVSTYSMLSHNTTAFNSSENVVLKSPLHFFLKYPNTRSDVYYILLEWSKCRCFLKMHARIISSSKTFL